MHPNIEGYNERVKRGEIFFVIVDGLDGSGKGELTRCLSEYYQLNNMNVVSIDYPKYTSYWGRVLRYLLDVDDLGLDIATRMAVYALNRLESLDKIMLEVGKLEGEVILIFDRFATSNILTMSYYYANGVLKDIDNEGEILEYLKSHLSEIEDYIKLIFEIDSDFIQFLSVNGISVCIPRISPEVSLQRIKNDKTRKGSDLYEKPKIQVIADFLYQIASQNNLGNLKILEQDNRDPQSIAKDIVDLYGYRRGEVGNPKLVQINLDKDNRFSDDIQNAMNNLLAKYPLLTKAFEFVEKDTEP